MIYQDRARAAIAPPLGEAPAFRAMLAQLSRAAPLDRPVLIVGERGTGKELLAARLNFLSRRWDRPFVKLNCATLAESLLDSELFGHEAGAFTGATKRRLSRFEMADGGTLFLDEIATASLGVQEKILRIIEYGTFERVGGNETLEVDVRMVAATNVDLPVLADQGKFRADLLDRLAFDVVTVPPLRERREDIPLLARHFGTGMARELGLDFFAGFTRDAEAALAGYDWPGNVRELRNVVERALYRATRPEKPIGEIVFDPFASPYRPGADMKTDAEATGKFEERVQAFEAGLLKTALERARFNRVKAAQELGLSYDQLRNLLKRHKSFSALVRGEKDLG